MNNYGKLLTKLKVDFKNAQGDPSNCESIATKFVNDKVDLILAIATNAAQAAANATKDIPIVLTAVTDPKYSGLVDTNEKPGGNVTGTSDLTPVEAQIELLKDILPKWFYEKYMKFLQKKICQILAYFIFFINRSC